MASRLRFGPVTCKGSLSRSFYSGGRNEGGKNGGGGRKRERLGRGDWLVACDLTIFRPMDTIGRSLLG